MSYLILTFLTVVLFCFTFRTWQYDAFTYPLMYSHDGIESLKLIKHITQGYDHWQVNPSLGSPEGSNLYLYFPTADSINITTLKLLSYLTNNYVIVLNSYIFLTYLFVSWTAYFVLRRLKIHWYFALLGALVFSFLPYHQIRTTVGHLFLINYATVPFSVYIALQILWLQKTDLPSSVKSFIHAQSPLFFLGWLIVLVTIGSTGTAYYAFFTVLIWGLASMLTSLKLQSFKPLIFWFILSSVVTIVVLINIYPALLHAFQQQSQSETNQKLFSLIERNPIQIEEFGLRLNRFFIPLPSKYFPFNGMLKTFTSTVQHELFQFPGFFALTGIIITLLAFFPNKVRTISVQISKALNLLLSTELLSKKIDQTYQVALLLVGIFLLFSTGGGALLIGHTITTSIRSYGRISIFIAFIGIVVLCKLATFFIENQSKRNNLVQLFSVLNIKKVSVYKTLLVPFFFTALAVYSLLYQSSLYDAHLYGWQTRKLFDADRAFITKIEQTIPYGTRILQLPLVQYPEARGQCQFDSYDHLRPYLHSDKYDWSFGALPNSVTWKQQSQWQSLFEKGQYEYFLGLIALSGYEAIYIDARSCLPAWSLQGDITKITNGTLHSSETQHALIIDISQYSKSIKEKYQPGF